MKYGQFFYANFHIVSGEGEGADQEVVTEGDGDLDQDLEGRGLTNDPGHVAEDPVHDHVLVDIADHGHDQGDLAQDPENGLCINFNVILRRGLRPSEIYGLPKTVSLVPKHFQIDKNYKNHEIKTTQNFSSSVEHQCGVCVCMC